MDSLRTLRAPTQSQDHLTLVGPVKLTTVEKGFVGLHRHLQGPQIGIGCQLIFLVKAAVAATGQQGEEPWPHVRQKTRIPTPTLQT
jgi:hypothetical protein